MGVPVNVYECGWSRGRHRDGLGINNTVVQISHNQPYDLEQDTGRRGIKDITKRLQQCIIIFSSFIAI